MSFGKHVWKQQHLLLPGRCSRHRPGSSGCTTLQATPASLRRSLLMSSPAPFLSSPADAPGSSVGDSRESPALSSLLLLNESPQEPHGREVRRGRPGKIQRWTGKGKRDGRVMLREGTKGRHGRGGREDVVCPGEEQLGRGTGGHPPQDVHQPAPGKEGRGVISCLSVCCVHLLYHCTWLGSSYRLTEI